MREKDEENLEQATKQHTLCQTWLPTNEDYDNFKREAHMMLLHKHLKLLKLEKEMQLHIKHLMYKSIHNKFDINMTRQIRNLLNKSQEFKVLRKSDKLQHQICQIIGYVSDNLIGQVAIVG